MSGQRHPLWLKIGDSLHRENSGDLAVEPVQEHRALPRRRRHWHAVGRDRAIERDIGLALHKEVFAFDYMAAVEQPHRFFIALPPRQPMFAPAGQCP